MSADRDRDRDRWNNRDRWGAEQRDDRGFFERAGDEVRSWFDDDDDDDYRRRRMAAVERDRGRPASYGLGRGLRDDVGYGEPRRGWADRDRNMDTERTDRARYGGRYNEGYGDYGEMAREGRGWAGSRTGRYDPYDGDRYGQRWGASDWREQAARAEGPYAGQGPSGYMRSSERILEDANEALTWHGQVDASQVQVRVEGDEVVLEGTVDSRRAKRAAEDAVEQVRGVRDVHNRLRVQHRQPVGGGPAEGSTQRGMNQGATSQQRGSSGQMASGQGVSGQSAFQRDAPGQDKDR